MIRDVAASLVVAFDYLVVAYFVLHNAIQLGLIGLAWKDIGHHQRRVEIGDLDHVYGNPLTPSITLIVAAYNEEVGLASGVRAILGLHYPAFDVVIVDDGSTDGTFAELERAFGLVSSPKVMSTEIATNGRVLSTWVGEAGRLTVVRKENAGSRADALNVGLNAATGTLVCMVDADSMLEEDALLRVVRPFIDDPLRVVATGGVICIGNGCEFVGGRLRRVAMPRAWTARIQVVEYLRSFLLGRVGWSKLDGLLIISGAFGLFRRDVVMELGGLDPRSLGEDAELVARLHHDLRRQKRDYRVVFVSDPVCWTEVPESIAILARQRRRWSRGLAQVLWRHRGMMLNPRYGVLGLVTMPFYLIFELLGPIIELTGLVAVVVALALGLLNLTFAVLFLAASIALGVIVSLAALGAEEFSFHRYERWRDLPIAVAVAVLENLGYRQLHAWWRLQGLWAELRRSKAGWGAMPRVGLVDPIAISDTAPVHPVPERAHVPTATGR